MTVKTPDAEVRLALFELQRYLSDELAPMMAAGSVEMLLDQPAQLVASAIQGWVTAQYRGPGASVPVSDYLFHSVKKIFLMSQLDLLEREPTVKFLEGLAQILLGLCPEEDREMLLTNLRGLSDSDGEIVASPVEIVHRQAGSGTPTVRSAVGSGPPIASVAGLGSRRLTLLVERLRGGAAGGAVAAGAGAAGGAAVEASPELLTEILAGAAIQARSGTELEQTLGQLGQ